MKFKFSHWIFRYWPLKNFGAITLPWATYFSTNKEETDPVTIRHEEIHWEQRARIGSLRFYAQYLLEYLFNTFKYKFDLMKAYREISFEKEAYAKENETIVFPNGSKLTLSKNDSEPRRGNI